jgi:transposase
VTATRPNNESPRLTATAAVELARLRAENARLLKMLELSPRQAAPPDPAQDITKHELGAPPKNEASGLPGRTACQLSLIVAEGGCEPAETRKSATEPWEIDDGLRARIEPLLPAVPRNPRHPGRKRLDPRKVLCGILFVLYTGIRWEFLPQELGFGSGMTCWRRLRDWNEAGVWKTLHKLLLSELRAANLLDFSRAAVDSSHIRAMKGEPATGPSPVDQGKTGSKHHVIVDAHGIPLATITTGGNRNDVTQLIPLIEADPPIRGKRGQPLRRP